MNPKYLSLLFSSPHCIHHLDSVLSLSIPSSLSSEGITCDKVCYSWLCFRTLIVQRPLTSLEAGRSSKQWDWNCDCIQLQTVRCDVHWSLANIRVRKGESRYKLDLQDFRYLWYWGKKNYRSIYLLRQRSLTDTCRVFSCSESLQFFFPVLLS